MIYDYTWLVQLLTEFGQKYPVWFDVTIGDKLQVLVPVFWFIVLWGLTHPYERRENRK